MFGINANLKKTAAIATIALTAVFGAANASAQQVWAEEVMAQQGQTQTTADSKAADKADSNAS